MELPVPPAEDLLFELELTIARRADVLAQSSSSRSDLECWLHAETEVVAALTDSLGLDGR